MSQSHNYALLTIHPIKPSEVTLGAAGALTACDIVGKIEYDPEYMINLERKDGAGNLVGSKHQDLKETINMTVQIPEGFTIPALRSVAVIDVDEGIGTKFNGNWEIVKMPLSFENGGAAECRLTLERSEFKTLTPE